MKRNIKLIDEENKISMDIKLDDENEFIEILGIEYDKKPAYIVEVKRYDNLYKK